MPNKLKRGAISTPEIQFLRDHSMTKSVEQMAKELNRSEDFIKKHLELYCAPTPDMPAEDIERINITQDLMSTEAWESLKLELTADEMKLFKEHYIGMMSQFKGDVLYTEQNQVFDAIKLEVLKRRNMIRRKEAAETIARMSRLQAEFIDKLGPPETWNQDQRTQIMTQESQIQNSKKIELDQTTEFTKIQKDVEAIRKSLNAQRDQRKKDVEDRGKDFIGTIKWLMDKDVQVKEGRMAELHKLAGIQEYDRLGQPHTYEDGQVDLPILSADTMESSGFVEQEPAAEEE